MTIELKDDNNGARLRLTVLASDVLTQWGDRFAFDFSTLNVADRVPLDYDHDDARIIGYAEGFDLSAEAVTADAVLLSAEDSPSLMAKEVDYNLRAGVPYEVSPLIDLENAVETRVPEGSTATVNGREVLGPVSIYTAATIRGVAICPHGTDAKTSAFIAFKAPKDKEFPKMDDKNKNDNVDEKKPLDAPTDEDGGDEGRKIDPALEGLVEEFGRDAGVDYYLRGYSLEQARAEDYAALKKFRDDLAKKDKDAADAAKDAKDEEEKQLSAKIVELEKRLLTLSALVRRGDDAGVSDSPAGDAVPVAAKKDALRAAAERLATMGTVRKF